MATTTHKIIGKAMWAKVFPENRDMEGYKGQAVETEGQYQIGLILDKAGRQALKASGSAAVIKFDDDGNMKPVTFRRDHKHRFDWAGGAPKVTKPDGTPWVYAEDSFIPNDSEVEVTYTVYTTSGANGTRLESVKVLKVAPRPELEDKPKEDPKPVRSSTGDEEIPF